jgi:hypothetical protein
LAGQHVFGTVPSQSQAVIWREAACEEFPHGFSPVFSLFLLLFEMLYSFSIMAQ